MRRILVISGIVIGVLVAGVVALLLLVDVNQFRSRIQTELQTKLGRSVALGNMGLRLIPLSIRVDDAVIGESPAFGADRPFASARQLRVSVGLLPLLRKEVRVDSFLLQEPAIELVRNAAGKWNFSDLGGGGGSSGGGFAFGDVRIENGRIAVSDLGKGGSRTVYEKIGLSLKSAGPGEYSGRLEGAGFGIPVRLDFNVNYDDSSGVMKAQALQLTVGKTPVQISGSMDTKASRVDARASVTDAKVADLLDLARAFGAGSVTGSGVLTLNASVEGPLDNPSYSGTGSLRDASLKTAALTKPVEIRSANLKLGKDTASVDGLVCSLGSSTLRGNVGIRNFKTPDANFRLEIDKLDLAELQSFSAGEKSSGGHEAPSTGAMSARGTISVGSIRYGGVDLNQVRAECSLSRGVLTLDPLTAEVFGGKQTGSMTFDMRAHPPKISLVTKLDGVDADKLLTATTSVKKTLYGMLAASGNASIALTPGGEMARGLNGDLNVNLTKGRLAGINMLNEAASLAKFVGFTPRKDPFTNIVQLVGDLKVRDGVASTDNLQLQLDSGKVACAGTMNLVDQSLNLRITTILDAETSRKVGGTGIGGLLTTALSGANGDLVIPALVTGTFAKPRFMPDAARMAEMKLSGLTGKKGVAGSILGGLTSKQGQPGAASPAQGLSDLLNSLRGKDSQPKPAKP